MEEAGPVRAPGRAELAAIDPRPAVNHQSRVGQRLFQVYGNGVGGYSVNTQDDIDIATAGEAPWNDDIGLIEPNITIL